jgi:uncharacterized membrane protein YeaQ/YmgE (transglycosylase-associated protein family)
MLSLLGWIVLGLIAGFIASLDIVIGIIGAIAGGWLFHLLGSTGVTGFNLWSLMVAVIGGVLLLFIRHAIQRTGTYLA